MTSYEVQRRNMVDSQVLPSDVTDRRIWRAMLEIPREAFVPDGMRATAYMDRELPVERPAPGRAQRALMSPRVAAKLIQHLELGDKDRVLEVGCATGYAAALLARIAERVVALEVDAGLADTARGILAGLGVGNVDVVTGPLAAGHAAAAPYDAILIGGAVPELPAALLDQLKDGGRLTVVVTGAGVGRAMQWRRLGGHFDSRILLDATAPPLPGFDKAEAFVF